ncbi:MAG: protein kinase [Bryobacterales bacterium]
MTPESYRRIGAIFAEAADLEGEARASYLDRECGQDDELRRQVLSLLEADGDDVVVSRPPQTSRREDFSGRSLGRYRIGEKIGEGGMSTVYGARDTKLDRTVALKFLTPQLLRTEQAFARFVREAKASAALDHPNICTTYDFEQVDGHNFIVMALLQGKTLAQKLESGPLRIVEAVDVARQAARGLRAAHLKGVVHRDVKPGNLMLVEAGVVKVMDFGVARLQHGETLTDSGMTIGTIAYMSPEQIEGGEVDGRSDIWALGAVLYEMLAGRSPFDRPAARETLAAIRAVEPRPLSELRSDIPLALAETVSRCLRKNRAERYQDAGQLRDRLDEIHDQLRTRELTAERPALPRPFFRRAGPALALAAAVAALLLFVFWELRTPTGYGAPSEAPLTVEHFTSLPGFETEPAISPDGTRIAYAWDRGELGMTDIYVQLLGSYEPMQLTSTPDIERNPVWSPTVRRSLSLLRGRLAELPRRRRHRPCSGRPRTAARRNAGESFAVQPRLSPNDDLLAVSDNERHCVAAGRPVQTDDSPPLEKSVTAIKVRSQRPTLGLRRHRPG